MRCSAKSIYSLPMTAMLLTAALVIPVVAAPAVPFRGSVQAVENLNVQFPMIFVDASGGGNATHLGRFTVSYEVEVTLPAGTGVGTAVFTAANGDLLFTEFTGQAEPTADPDVSFIEETQTITGGTGRFEGASGSFTLQRFLNGVTGITSGSFDGTIEMQHGK
jgi:hypothetical protein